MVGGLDIVPSVHFENVRELVPELTRDDQDRSLCNPLFMRASSCRFCAVECVQHSERLVAIQLDGTGQPNERRIRRHR